MPFHNIVTDTIGRLQLSYHILSGCHTPLNNRYYNLCRRTQANNSNIFLSFYCNSENIWRDTADHIPLQTSRLYRSHTQWLIRYKYRYMDIHQNNFFQSIRKHILVNSSLLNCHNHDLCNWYTALNNCNHTFLYCKLNKIRSVHEKLTSYDRDDFGTIYS